MSTSSTVLSKRVDGPTAARLGKGLVWLFLGLTAAGSAGTMALWLAGCSPAQPIGNTDFLGRYGVYLILMVSGVAFSVLGTLIASLTLSVMRNGLTLLAIPTYYQQVITGTIILIAIIMAEIRNRRERETEA